MDIKDILKFIETNASQKEIKRIRLTCNRAISCEWIIYYLPNATRPGYLNSKGEPQVGKVGMTSKLIERRLRENAMDYDITDWRILETIHGTRQDALNLEKKWQITLDCLDNCNLPKSGADQKVCKSCNKSFSIYSITRHEKACKRRLEKKLDKFGFMVSRTTCQFCSKEITSNNIGSHERACKQNPNRSTKHFPKPACKFCGKEVSIFAITRHETKCGSLVNS
jgi:hypothetical protein